MIEHANPPFGWAIPSGFIDVREIIEQAAIPEAQEEVSLNCFAWYLFQSCSG
ncbi:MAG: NUDIX domain-containing protein [Methyloprofundus sp.]|nr:NUDIX domain-containing protein [Methyloprofundus sp.]